MAFADPNPTAVPLFSSAPSVAHVPATTVVVPPLVTEVFFTITTTASAPPTDQFTASGTFQVTTAAVGQRITATVTATWFGKTATTTVTVAPGAPPAPDKVAIKKAPWKPGPGPNGTLTIEATGTNPHAILSLLTSTGSFMFDLTNDGRGRYSDQRLFRQNPIRIEVRSNFGGSVSANT